MTENNGKVHKVNVYVPEEIWDSVRTICKDTNRSFNGLVNWLLKRTVRDFEKNKVKPTERR